MQGGVRELRDRSRHIDDIQTPARAALESHVRALSTSAVAFSKYNGVPLLGRPSQLIPGPRREGIRKSHTRRPQRRNRPGLMLDEG